MSRAHLLLEQQAPRDGEMAAIPGVVTARIGLVSTLTVETLAGQSCYRESLPGRRQQQPKLSGDAAPTAP
jgi:hypothetical protein